MAQSVGLRIPIQKLVMVPESPLAPTCSRTRLPAASPSSNALMAHPLSLPSTAITGLHMGSLARRKPLLSVQPRSLRVTAEVAGQDVNKPFNITPKKAAVWALPVFSTPYIGHIMAPYLLEKAEQAPFQSPLVGVEWLDKTFLALYAPIFRDMVSTPSGVVITGTFVVMCFSWFTAAAIESSRASSHSSFNLQNPGIVYSAAICIAAYLVLPCLWVADYVDINTKIPETREEAADKAVSVKSVGAVLGALWPFVFLTSVYFFSAVPSAPFGWSVTSSIFSPILGQLAWTPFKGEVPSEAQKGHAAAFGAHLLAAGAGLVWQATLIALIIKTPEISQQIPDLFVDQSGPLHGPFFMLVDDIILVATFGLIPLFEVGGLAALSFFAASPILGPSATLSFYFAWREARLFSLAGDKK